MPPPTALLPGPSGKPARSRSAGAEATITRPQSGSPERATVAPKRLCSPRRKPPRPKFSALGVRDARLVVDDTLPVALQSMKPSSDEAHLQDKHKAAKSKYTQDRSIPGAFEGETITRRRLMGMSVHG